ncbi:5-methylcytosine restriction system specificity protein McrC [Bdellovibrio bacteriovorus]|uniref:Putative 5-methylcytosine restriction system component MrcC n=1 Tax=Bdellovibrio bacteriovorus str. Tiberius TaxID=1069642 RepID=K7YJV5_BDEBC|nr:5-methylcytosine restriction system component MrcC [Bdellovibrio bacteriovorus]AFX99940.1 putative 5-methylcytosine restriction system component MrcC [Bdellovibrio bacteriovorus str. Tiberius]
MIKQLKSKLSQSALEHEYAGIDQDGVYLPKSLKMLSGEDLRTALRGVQCAWQRTTMGKGIYSTDSVTTDACTHKEFLEFLVLVWLRRFNFVLAQHLNPIFVRVSKSQNFCLGYVDYSKFEIESELGQTAFNCVYSELTFDRAEFRVIKDGYVQFVNHLIALGLNTKSIVRECTNGLQIVKDIPKSSDPISNAHNVRLRSGIDIMKNPSSIELPVKMMSLTEVIDFFSHYLMYGIKGVSKDKFRFKGLLFNLNYLLEIVLRCSLRSLYSDYSLQTEVFKDDEINEIQVIRNGQVVRYRNMRPDCQGVFSEFHPSVPKKLAKDFKNSIYLFDAKHKVLVKDQQVEDTKRNDLYQIVSYARTHNNRLSLQSFYGLVCLDEVTGIVPYGDILQGRYIRFGSDSNALTNKIIYDENEFDIFQIPINFAQLLFDVGSVATNEEVDKIFFLFGVELLSSIQETKTALRSAA